MNECRYCRNTQGTLGSCAGSPVDRDIVVMMDKSPSIHLDVVAEFVASLHQLFMVNTQSHLSLMSFGADVKVDMPLGQSNRDQW